MAELTASDILSIPLDQPHRLFPGDKADAGLLRRKLLAKWHPDRNADGAAVALHINALFDRALDALDRGIWVGPSHVRLQGRDGKAYDIKYRRSATFELGCYYLARRLIVYVIDEPFTDLAQRAVESIRRLKYRDDAMRQEHARYMPKIIKVIRLMQGTAIVIEKADDQWMLSDVLAHFGGKIDPKHVAWILSSLYNLNCYLKWTDIKHNDIGPHSYFISARQHNGSLLGGWWYAGWKGAKPIAVPQRSHRMGTDFTSKAIDGSLIRSTGLELLGSGFKDAPAPMQRWLRGLGQGNSYQEYEEWSAMLTASFGARRYAEMKLPDHI